MLIKNIFNIGILFFGLFLLGVLMVGSHGKADFLPYIMIALIISAGPIIDITNRKSKTLKLISGIHKALTSLILIVLPIVVLIQGDNFPLLFGILFIGIGILGIFVSVNHFKTNTNSRQQSKY